MLSSEVEMISGRKVREIRGYSWYISYQYGIFDDNTYIDLIKICEKGMREPINCTFLIQENDKLINQKFWVETYERPRFMFSREGKAVWLNFSVQLIGANIYDN